MRCIEVFNTFMSQDNKDLLICAVHVAVYARDLLLRVRKDYGAPTMPLEQAQQELVQEGEEEEEEHLSFSQLWVRMYKVEPAESIFPLAMVDQNERLLKFPLASHTRKGRNPRPLSRRHPRR